MRPLDLIEAHTLTEFQRNAEELIKRLKKNRRPLALTINGQIKAVVQDVKSYQELSRVIGDAYPQRIAGSNSTRVGRDERGERRSCQTLP